MTRGEMSQARASTNLALSLLLWSLCGALAVLADYRQQETFTKIFWGLWVVCLVTVFQWAWVVAKELREQRGR
jgi:hypothetical protein